MSFLTPRRTKEVEIYLIMQIDIFKKASSKTVAVGQELRPSTLVINCNQIFLRTKEIELEIEITRGALEKTNAIIINGIKFIKNDNK